MIVVYSMQINIQDNIMAMGGITESLLIRNTPDAD